MEKDHGGGDRISEDVRKTTLKKNEISKNKKEKRIAVQTQRAGGSPKLLKTTRTQERVQNCKRHENNARLQRSRKGKRARMRENKKKIKGDVTRKN